ncbi:hypothetical protein CCACVL1_01816 [Corchorus capsularis]|uniref:Uncharacterized protein n=1 Tax=Corchorus capsularis TaxID=210143 RepID=A0A1R3KFI0_COCAP|nr:hypothetical protein CCACVL1_01816 [Corchorus capsularis]
MAEPCRSVCWGGGGEQSER